MHNDNNKDQIIIDILNTFKSDENFKLFTTPSSSTIQATETIDLIPPPVTTTTTTIDLISSSTTTPSSTNKKRKRNRVKYTIEQEKILVNIVKEYEEELRQKNIEKHYKDKSIVPELHTGIYSFSGKISRKPRHFWPIVLERFIEKLKNLILKN